MVRISGSANKLVLVDEAVLAILELQEIKLSKQKKQNNWRIRYILPNILENFG